MAPKCSSAGTTPSNPVWTQPDGNCTFNNNYDGDPANGGIAVIDNSPQVKALSVTRSSVSCAAGLTSSFTKDYGAWHVLLKKTAGTDGNGIRFVMSYGGNGNYTLFVDSVGVRLWGPTAQIGSTYVQAVGAWHTYDITRVSLTIPPKR